MAYVDPSQCIHTERMGIEVRFAKVLRAFYVHQKSDEKPYSSIRLHTRLFTPVRKDYKQFESFSKTMQRTIKWMDYSSEFTWTIKLAIKDTSILPTIVYENGKV